MVFTIALITVCSAFSYAQKGMDKFESLVEVFEKSLMASDTEQLGKMFTKNAVAIHQDGTTTEGRKATKMYFSGLFSQVTYTETNIEITEVKKLAENLYYGRGTFTGTIKMKANGQSLKSEGLWSNIVVDDNGTMKVSRHMVMVPMQR